MQRFKASQADIYGVLQTSQVAFGRRWVFDPSRSFPITIQKYAVYRDGTLQERFDTDGDAIHWLKKNKMPSTNFSLESVIWKKTNKKGVKWRYHESGVFPTNINPEGENNEREENEM